MNLHICLISDQILPNYIPALMDKPDQVHLVSSVYMVNKGVAGRLERMLQQQGIATVLHTGMPDASIAAIRNYAMQLLEQVAELSADVITLNITGGNKLMTLGMWEAFGGVADRIIYTDTQHQRIEYLHNETQLLIEAVLDIPQYLMAQGAKYLRAASDDAVWVTRANKRKAVSKYLAVEADRLGGFIGKLNWMVSQALSRDGESLEQPGQQLDNGRPDWYLGRSWREALLKLVNADLLEWDGDRLVTFPDVDCARYLGGFWLEEYVFHVAREVRAQHVACGVEINWEVSRNSRNELDIILVHDNRMLVIECKTLRLGRDTQKDSDIVYKISDLGDELRGLFGDTWLVNARQSDSSMRARAKSRGITLIAPEDLRQLRQQILRWMEGAE